MTRQASIGDVVTGTPTATSWGNKVGDAIDAILDDIYAAGVGASLAIPWAKLTGVPATFAPSAHASSHLTGGSDPLTASGIGGFDRVAAGGTIGTRIYVGTGTPGAGADPDPVEGDVWIKG